MFTDQIPNEFTDIPDNIRQQDVVNDVDDEEDLLYGENSAFEMPTLESSIYLNNCSSNNKKSRNCWWKRYLLDIKTSYWLFVVRDNMNLEIYSIPDLSLSYLIKEIGHGHQVLTDELESISSSSTINVYEFVSKSQTEVKEIRMVALGSHGSRPMLFVRITNNLFIYDTFRYAKGNIKIRFRKCSIPMIYSASTSDVIDTENTDFYAIQDKKCQIRYFSNITGYNGVFIAGAKPHWVFLTYRGELRTHPMYIDGNVSCFTSFNNLNCPHGFIYLNGTVGILHHRLLYRVLQKCGAKFCWLIEDINRNNFYPDHFTCFAHLKKLRKIAKTLSFFVLLLKKLYKSFSTNRKSLAHHFWNTVYTEGKDVNQLKKITILLVTLTSGDFEMWKNAENGI